MARFRKGEGGRPRGVKNHATREIQEFSRGVLEDPSYVAELKVRITEGRAPQIEQLLYHYAYGKPRETFQVEGAVPAFVLKLDAD